MLGTLLLRRTSLPWLTANKLMPYRACDYCGNKFRWSVGDPICGFTHQQKGCLIDKLRLQIEGQYEVEQGRVTSAGIFENTEIFVPYFAQQMVNERAVHLEDTAFIEVNEVELRVFPELQGAFGIAISLSADQGLRYVVLQTRQDFDDAVLLEMSGLPQQRRARPVRRRLLRLM